MFALDHVSFELNVVWRRSMLALLDGKTGLHFPESALRRIARGDDWHADDIYALVIFFHSLARPAVVKKESLRSLVMQRLLFCDAHRASEPTSKYRQPILLPLMCCAATTALT
jgi:hypothetical protein